MNFKKTLLLLSFLTACGVKGPPIMPPDTKITPWIEEYDSPPPVIKAKNELDISLNKAVLSRNSLLIILNKFDVDMKNIDKRSFEKKCIKLLAAKEADDENITNLIKFFNEYQAIVENRKIKGFYPVPEEYYQSLISFYQKNIDFYKTKEYLNIISKLESCPSITDKN